MTPPQLSRHTAHGRSRSSSRTSASRSHDEALAHLAKVIGALTWHSHDDEDDLFLVLKGALRIEMEERAVTLKAGELFVVPKGVRHNPVADEECHILLFERKSTAHTGDVKTDLTSRSRSNSRVDNGLRHGRAVALPIVENTHAMHAHVTDPSSVAN